MVVHQHPSPAEPQVWKPLASSAICSTTNCSSPQSFSKRLFKTDETPIAWLAGRAHDVFSAIFLIPFLFPMSRGHIPNTALFEYPSHSGSAFTESIMLSFGSLHSLSYAFYNSSVSHWLSPRFLPAGEYSYLGTTLRQVNIEPMPSLADIRQLIALYGILPLGKTTAAITTMALLPVTNTHFYWLWQGLINGNLKHFAV